MKTTKHLKAWPFTIQIDLELKDKDLEKPVFSASAMIYKGGEERAGGQCREHIDEIFKKAKGLYKYNEKDRETRDKINYLREKHHLNDLHAWTPRQEKRLKDNKGLLDTHGIKGRASNYSETCELLKKFDLYNDEGREFGRGWNYWPIPEPDLSRIKDLIREIDEENKSS